MIKKILLICGMILTFMPINILAKYDLEKITSTNLKETLEMEGIELLNKEYEENDKQIVVYLFRSSACQYTKPLLEYLNSISESHGEYFRLVSYDVNSNQDNIDFFKEVAKYFNSEAMGVPYFVIGSRNTIGYNEEEKDLIGQWIMDEYNNKNRFDLLSEMSKPKVSTQTDKKDVKDNKFDFKKVYYIVIGTSIIVIILLFVMTMNKNNPEQIEKDKNTINKKTNKKIKEKSKRVKEKVKEKTKKVKERVKEKTKKKIKKTKKEA